MTGRGTIGVVVAGAIAVAGCYSWVPIKATELPKLNGASTIPVASMSLTPPPSPGVTPAGAMVITKDSVAHVERPDGSLVEIKGQFDAQIDTPSGSTLFEYPVRSAVQDSSLLVQGANRAPTTIPLQQVTRVQVSQLNTEQTLLVSLLVTVASLVVGAAIAGAP